MNDPTRDPAPAPPTTRARVLVLSPFYLPAWRGGGPIRTLAAMTAQHGHRHQFCVLTSAFDWGGEQLDVDTERWRDVGAARVRYLPITGLRSLASPHTLRVALRAWREAVAAPTGEPDITYLTGVFPAVWSILPLLAHRIGLLPTRHLLIAPRGEFGAGALELKAAKKKRFLDVARATGLFRDVTWHASSPMEAADIRPALPDADVLVAQNETALPTHAHRPRPARHHRPLRIVYLGRLSPKKGVDTLLRALPHVTAPVQVTVVGSATEDTYLAHLHDLADASPHPVTFRGGLPHERIADTLAEHDLFVFPTANENFGHAVAESLAASVPVMLRRTSTPWPDLLGPHTQQALHLLDTLDPIDWATAIDTHAHATPTERERARTAAADAYDAWRTTTPTTSVFDLLLERETDSVRR